MISRLDDEIGFMSKALNLRAHRQQLLAGNIANADTPGYKAVDIDFLRALNSAIGSSQSVSMNMTVRGHLQPIGSNPLGVQTLYRQPAQPSIDGNTVDMDVERTRFIDNAIHYQFALDRVAEDFKEMQLALRGQ
ncbi:MAG: flagellar basal body rod protein FlgB [Sulfurimicrobium sp.]|nr:flagellar basal body rod protein FlgB [Sulfurimicrobium sp.]MDP1703752.1 flagellar basal body rod protein FlgB [Sulfurimicrobium sp.]MDP2199157.1 flagellar basal body rod protein FlgB [Sulfurimicrobium sp.]MDP3688490.1 flagellar basal body rod protein FlgB [Sulfurimicrobium sp.]